MYNLQPLPAKGNPKRSIQVKSTIGPLSASDLQGVDAVGAEMVVEGSLKIPTWGYFLAGLLVGKLLKGRK